MRWECDGGRHHYSDERRGTLAVVWRGEADKYRPARCFVLVAGWPIATTEPDDLEAAKAKAEKAVWKIHGLR